MALGNTPSRETNILVEASKSFSFGILFQTPDKEPVVLTDAVIRLVMAQPPYLGGVEVLTLIAEHVSDSGGLVRFNFQAEDLALDPGAYTYDVTLVPATGYSTPILKGSIQIGSNVDLDDTNVYTVLNPASEITATLYEQDLVQITIEHVDGMFSATRDLITNFQTYIEGQVTAATDAATDAQYWSNKTTTDIAGLQTWMANAGFPYWKGSSVAFFALPAPDPSVMYLLTD